jgi:hypothetical protein
MIKKTMTLQDYALGRGTWSGVALISGDCDGFEVLHKPLSLTKIRAVLNSYLADEEAIENVEELRKLVKSDWIIEEIKETHDEFFKEYQLNNQ